MFKLSQNPYGEMKETDSKSCHLTFTLMKYIHKNKYVINFQESSIFRLGCLGILLLSCIDYQLLIRYWTVNILSHSRLSFYFVDGFVVLFFKGVPMYLSLTLNL